jgi:two-component system, LytTR family, sensor kinase
MLGKKLHLFPNLISQSMLDILNSRKRIFFHIAYWICAVLLFTFLWGTRYNNYWVCFYNELVFLPIKLGVTYFGLYYIIPKLLLKRKYIRLIVASVVMITAGGILQRILVYYSFIPLLGVSELNTPLFDTIEILNHVININSVMIIPFALKLYSYSLEKENRILTLSQEKTKAELLFLRSQIQPHFLFNVLNDLYAMALKQSDKTADVILKLSDLMRYVLQESTADVVSIEKEINYIRNYIDLEKLRYGDRFSIDLQVTSDVSECFITPLLLLPFVENAFKHSTNAITGAWITIKIKINNHELTLDVANSYDPGTLKSDHISSGIGIKNIRQRLDILYPDRYVFLTETVNNSYKTTLKINLLS